MFRSSRWAHVVAVAAIALLAMLDVTAVKAASTSGIGVVDLVAIQKDYKGTVEAYGRFQKFQEDAYATFSPLQSGIGLTEADFAIYQKLMQQPAKDKDAIAKLEQQAQDNVKQFNALDAKLKAGEKLSDADQASYDTLQKQCMAVYAQLQDMQQKAETSLQAEAQRYQDILMAQITATLEKVAKDQKLLMVMSKNVQTDKGTEQLILWNDKSIDVTEKVLTTLNANYDEKIFKTN